jgi:hypothetical protein
MPVVPVFADGRLAWMAGAAAELPIELLLMLLIVLLLTV